MHLTYDDAARSLNVPFTVVHDMVKDGRLKEVSVQVGSNGRQFFIDSDSLDTYLANKAKPVHQTLFITGKRGSWSPYEESVIKDCPSGDRAIMAYRAAFKGSTRTDAAIRKRWSQLTADITRPKIIRRRAPTTGSAPKQPLTACSLWDRVKGALRGLWGAIA